MLRGTSGGSGASGVASITSGTISGVTITSSTLGTGVLPASVISAQTSTTYAVASTDAGTVVKYTGAGAGSWTIAQATGAGLGAGFSVSLENRESGAAAALTLTPTVSTVNGNATLVIPYGFGASIESDGANYFSNFYSWLFAPLDTGSAQTVTAVKTFNAGTMSAAGPVIAADTYANQRTAGSAHGGRFYAVNNLGPANALVVSDGTNLHPVGGRVIVLQTGIPIGIPSNGTFGTTGNLSAIAALPTTYSDIYLWFPANAIKSGQAAGLYYCQMASTTAGTVFQETYSSGTPTIPASPTAWSGGTNAGYTQTTGAALNLHSVTVPGNSLGLNGTLDVDVTESQNNASSNHIITVKYGTAIPSQVTTTTTSLGRWFLGITNRGKASAQVSRFSQGSNTGNSTNASVAQYSSIDSTSDQTLLVTGQITTAASDFLIIEEITAAITA